jgi:hypothetical protein
VNILAAHRILIGAAIVRFAFWAGRSLWVFAREGGGELLLQALVALAAGVVLAVYYRKRLGRWNGPS